MLFLFLQEKMYRNNILCRIDNPTVGKIDITPDEQLKPISASTVIAHLYRLIFSVILTAGIAITLKCDIKILKLPKGISDW